MPLQQVPPAVLKFITEKIDTVVELEALLILCQERDRSWTEQELAARLYTPPSQARKALESLARRQLVLVAERSTGYRFNAHSEDNCQLVAEVEQAYRNNLVAISTYIHSKASVSVKEFARAFDLKKEQ